MDDKNRYWSAMRKNDYDESVRSRIINVLGNRDYTLFAVLADVRNNSIQSLFANRGLPKDAANRTKKEIEERDSDYHSHTYFTVQELLNTKWDKVGQSHGTAILFADQYQTWKDTGKVPDDAQEYAYGGGVSDREVSEEEMTMLLMSNETRALVKTKKSGGEIVFRSGPYVQIESPRTYRQLVPQLISIIPDLQKLGDPEKVRIVIAFDN